MFFLFTMSFSNETDTDISNYDYITSLYKKYGRALWKYAYTISQNNEIANDLVSITFLKAIEKIEIIKEVHKYKIKSYLMSMVKNTYINYVNKEKLIVDINITSDYSCNINNDFAEEIGVSEVEEALNHMPEPYKSILILRYVYDELTYEEIALSLNISPKSIRVYKKRAIEMLKQRLKGGEIKNG